MSVLKNFQGLENLGKNSRTGTSPSQKKTQTYPQQRTKFKGFSVTSSLWTPIETCEIHILMFLCCWRWKKTSSITHCKDSLPQRFQTRYSTFCVQPLFCAFIHCYCIAFNL